VRGLAIGFDSALVGGLVDKCILTPKIATTHHHHLTICKTIKYFYKIFFSFETKSAIKEDLFYVAWE